MGSESPPISSNTPPFDLEAERAVLGGILLDNQILNSLIDVVKPEDFYRESHRLIFETMIEIVDGGEVIDLISLKNELDKHKVLETIGGIETISGLLEETSSAANLEYYAGIVREKSILRKLIRAAEVITREGYQASGEVRDIVDAAESRIFEIAQSGETRGPRHIKDVIHSTFDDLARLSEKPSLVTGLPTGFEDLDTLTTGFHGGELVIIAGRPSMGKTTLGLNIVQHLAIKEKTPCLVFSLEMTQEQLVQRFLSAEAEVDGQNLRRGIVKGEDWSKLARAAGELSQAPIYIDDTPAVSILEMRSRARRIKSKCGLGLVVVDYMQLMQSRRHYESRQLEISDISRSLKFMAKELGCPVLALSQLSRAVEARKENRPQLSDLRESGAIEQDADVVMMIYRPEKYDIQEIHIRGRKENSKGVAEIIIAKQRNGPTGSVFLAFREHLLQFRDILFNMEDQQVASYPEEFD
ncbi:replicative DNA helicase [bacterium]|nr:replicative DNA helicase [candidate division CSSED10-310 bacterium]